MKLLVGSPADDNKQMQQFKGLKSRELGGQLILLGDGEGSHDHAIFLGCAGHELPSSHHTGLIPCDMGLCCTALLGNGSHQLTDFVVDDILDLLDELGHPSLS